jgi:hypothetical protein
MILHFTFEKLELIHERCHPDERRRQDYTEKNDEESPLPARDLPL